MILTDQEILAAITSLYQSERFARMAIEVSTDDYRAIEQAVIAKLAQGVSVEPSYYWEPDGTIEWMKEGSGFSTNTGPAHGWKITHYYTATAIAAARVAALEEAAVAADLFCNGGESQRPLKYPVATAIRALIGGAT